MAIKEQILWLEVPVNDVSRVKVLEGEGHFSSIEFGNGIGEALELHQLEVPV